MDGQTQRETPGSSQTRDEDLKRRIICFLLGRGLPSLRYLDVEVREGVAILRGRVQTYYEKQLATCCCRHVAGVLRIVDDIHVAERHSRTPVSETQFPGHDSVEGKQ